MNFLKTIPSSKSAREDEAREAFLAVSKRAENPESGKPDWLSAPDSYEAGKKTANNGFLLDRFAELPYEPCTCDPGCRRYVMEESEL